MSFMPPRQYTCTSIRISSGICWDHFWSIKKAVCIPICMQLYTLVRFSPNMVKSMDWMASWRYSLLQGYGNKQCAQRRCWAWVVHMHSTVFELIGVLCRIRKHADYDVCACPEDGRHFSTHPTRAAFSFLSFPSAYAQTCYSTIYSEDGRITLSTTLLHRETSMCIDTCENRYFKHLYRGPSSSDGISAVNQTNLALKAIIGIAAMAKITSVVGQSHYANRYQVGIIILHVTSWSPEFFFVECRI